MRWNRETGISGHTHRKVPGDVWRAGQIWACGDGSVAWKGVLHSWNSRSKGLEDASMEPDCHLSDRKSGTPIPKRRDVEVRTFDVVWGSESLRESRCCGLDHAPS